MAIGKDPKECSLGFSPIIHVVPLPVPVSIVFVPPIFEAILLIGGQGSQPPGRHFAPLVELFFAQGSHSPIGVGIKFFVTLRQFTPQVLDLVRIKAGRKGCKSVQASSEARRNWASRRSNIGIGLEATATDSTTEIVSLRYFA